MGTTILTLSVVLLLILTSQSTSNVVRGNDDVANERAAYLNDRREHTEYTDDGRVIEIITMGDIDAMMRLENFENVASGGLRKLEDDTCWHGGQDNQVLQWLGNTWGSCQTMSKCFCGMHPRRMAYWCPQKCRPSCGGSCAYTPGISSCPSSNSGDCTSCPDGFNLVGGDTVTSLDTGGTLAKDYDPANIDADESYPNFWPGNWGADCSAVDSNGALPYNIGEPSYSGPTKDVKGTGASCAVGAQGGLSVNDICGDSESCDCGLVCVGPLSDGYKRCSQWHTEMIDVTPETAAEPSAEASPAPTSSPTSSPTTSPTASPTSNPTALLTASPTTSPTASPTASPTSSPTYSPTASPTTLPTASPTVLPSEAPTPTPLSTGHHTLVCVVKGWFAPCRPL